MLVIHSCHVLLVEELYLNNHNTNKRENLHVNVFFLACALSGYIFVNPFTSSVTDCYQHKQCFIMETETEKIHVLRFYWLCVQLVAILFLLTLLLLVLLIVIYPSNADH